MRPDDVRAALATMASDVRAPNADASAAIALGQRRVRARRVTIGALVLLMLAIVVGAEAIGSDDEGTSRDSSTPTTVGSITVRQPYSGPVLIPMAFTSANEGWLCTGPTMRYTNDAGATWKEVTVPFGPPASPRIQQPICAAVEGGEAWMITGAVRGDQLQVIHVSDGGDNVETFPFPSVSPAWTVRELSFADSRHGWASLRSAGGGAMDAYVTDDGGRTWESDTLVRHAPLWASPTDGWSLGELGGFAHTSDGGETWQHVRLNESDTVRPIATVGDAVVILGSTVNGVRSDPSFAVASRTGSGPFEDGPRDAVGSVTMPGVASALDTEHWRLGIANRLWATADGGRQWDQIAEFAGISQVTDVHFLTPDVGFVAATGTGDAANSSVVLRTGDGGGTWATVATQMPGRTRASKS